jgi:hypothetical protein
VGEFSHDREEKLMREEALPDWYEDTKPHSIGLDISGSPASLAEPYLLFLFLFFTRWLTGHVISNKGAHLIFT